MPRVLERGTESHAIAPTTSTSVRFSRRSSRPLCVVWSGTRALNDLVAQDNAVAIIDGPRRLARCLCRGARGGHSHVDSLVPVRTENLPFRVSLQEIPIPVVTAERVGDSET